MQRSNQKKGKLLEGDQKKADHSGNNGQAANTPTSTFQMSLTKKLNMITILLSIGTIIIAINFYALLRLQSHVWTSRSGTNGEQALDPADSSIIMRPKVWIQGQNIEGGYLRHVFEVFEKLGYLYVDGSVAGPDGSPPDWDVLFSHDYPFTKGFFKKLEPHQRVNHFPGSGYITNKVSLATSGMKHMPKGFHLPDEKSVLMEYDKSHPGTLWVQKSNDHRGIRVENLDRLDLKNSNTFIQEFVQNPLLIDGKKFDIGVYVTMTSVNPLRVYIYENDFLLRFCYSKYHPFNSSNFDSYVVTDDYTPTWDIPSLRKYFVDLNLNMKKSLSGYLRSIGKDPEEVYEKINEAIATVYTSKQAFIGHLTTAIGSRRNFFEMVRFDFLLDEELNVYLMEANMSPNLSSLHFAPNAVLYEQVLFNTLSLVGLSRILEGRTWANFSGAGWDMRVSEKDLSVFEDACADDECHLSCRLDKCRVCHYCLSAEMKVTLKDAYLEHGARWNYRRIIPNTDESAVQPNDSLNELQRQWVLGKCVQDTYWC